MTVPLTGGQGLFDRIGAIGGMFNLINTHRGTTIPGKVNTFTNMFDTADLAMIDGLYPALTQFQGSMGGFPQRLKQYASTIIIQMVANDAPQPTSSLDNAIAYIITQMRANANSVKAATIGSSITPNGGNQGNGNLQVATKTQTGLVLENIIPETLTLTCTSDSQTGGRTAGQETFTVTDAQPTNDTLSWLWPNGSASSGSLSVIDPSQNQQSSGNMLNNSDFETFTVTNRPDQWSINIGTPGGTVFKDTGAPYFGLADLKITGNGSELTELAQRFNNAVGTTVSLAPSSQYLVSLRTKVSSVPGAGILQVALTDGTNVINDVQGNPSSFTIALTGETTSYAFHSGTFRTPAVMPAQQWIRLKLTTALTNAVSVFIDSVGMTPGTQLYTGGEYVALWRGANKFYLNDYVKLALSSDYGGSAGAGYSFQSLFDRLFLMKSLGRLLPSAGSPSISDSLIA